MTTETNSETQSISNGKLWFGFVGGACAWTLAGVLDVFLAWQACMGGESGGAFSQTGVRIILGFITFGLLATAVTALVLSYKNWRKLSDAPNLLESEARDRREYLAICGVIVSITLGFGLIWFSIPIYILGVCVRAR